MSTKHIRSAADLARFKCALRIECGSCHNARTLNGFDVARAHGTKTFAQIRRRMKCSRCGEKEAQLTVFRRPDRGEVRRPAIPRVPVSLQCRRFRHR